MVLIYYTLFVLLLPPTQKGQIILKFEMHVALNNEHKPLIFGTYSHFILEFH